MTTTIKVTTALRDRLKSQATASGRTLGEHLAVLADEADRAERFDRLRRQIAATPPDLMESYREEARGWLSGGLPALADDDFSDWPGYAEA